MCLAAFQTAFQKLICHHSQLKSRLIKGWRLCGFIFVFSAILSGCQSTPVPTLPAALNKGDELRSCDSLKNEVASIQVTTLKLALQRDEKQNLNQTYFFLGFITLFTFALIDLSEPEVQLIAAYSARTAELNRLMTEKGCNM